MASTPAEVKPGIYDWSTVEGPMGNQLFDVNEDRKRWTRYRLSKDQVSKFWMEGYLINIPVLTHDQCDLILEDYKHLTGEKGKHPAHDLLYEYKSNHTGDPNNILMHSVGQWRMTQLFHDLIYHPKIVVPCSQLLVEGKEMSVRLWRDQAFAKPAKHGGVVSWHQDYSYWTRTLPCMHVTCHIALDDQTEENGTLQYIPGSHRWLRDSKPFPVLDNFNDMEEIKTILTEQELSHFKPVPSLLKKGEASFHCSLTVHGSYGNKSVSPRRAAALNFFGDGVYSDTDDLLVIRSRSDINDSLVKQPSGEELFANAYIKKGEKMQGQFFPLVFDENWTDIKTTMA